jgi:hypothetical protein
VINGVISLWKTDSIDQGNIIYVWGLLEDHGHTVKILTSEASTVPWGSPARQHRCGAHEISGPIHPFFSFVCLLFFGKIKDMRVQDQFIHFCFVLFCYCSLEN